MMTKAQLDAKCEAQMALMDTARTMSTSAFLHAVQAVIEARPHADPQDIEWAAQRMSRWADELERRRR